MSRGRVNTKLGSSVDKKAAFRMHKRINFDNSVYSAFDNFGNYKHFDSEYRDDDFDEFESRRVKYSKFNFEDQSTSDNFDIQFN